MVNIKANKNNLDKLMKSLKTNYTLRVGILGKNATATKEDTNLSNGKVAAFQEFGTKNIPQRSFLAEPLKKGLQFDNDEMKALKKSAFKAVYKDNKPEKFFNAMGAKSLDVIEASFKAGGDPRWTPLAASTVKYKRKAGLSSDILTATGQMRNSVTFEVKQQ